MGDISTFNGDQMTRGAPCIAVITSDVPVGEDVLAWGMSHVNTRLLRGLGARVNMIIVSRAFLKDVDPALQSKTVALSSPFIFRAVRKAATLLWGHWMKNAGFRLILPGLVRRLKESGATWVFCPCGADFFDLERAVLLADAAGLPLAAYLVDDFLESAELSGDKNLVRTALNDVPGWVRRVDRLFVISDGFRCRIKELYNKDAVVLPLPYDLTGSSQIKGGDSAEQIIFVGNCCHFYADGLRQLAVVLDEINLHRDKPIVLRLTLPDRETVRKMVGDFRCIRCAPCEGAGALQAEIAASLMAFVPYSFAAEHKVMTQTSFPSKILLCLAASRQVLVYGPADSSSVRYFRGHGLPTVLCQEDPVALRGIVLRQISEKQDHGAAYRQVVANEHSSAAVAEKIIAGLYDDNR